MIDSRGGRSAPGILEGDAEVCIVRNEADISILAHRLLEGSAVTIEGSDLDTIEFNVDPGSAGFEVQVGDAIVLDPRHLDRRQTPLSKRGVRRPTEACAPHDLSPLPTAARAILALNLPPASQNPADGAAPRQG